jgi:hypothetical protein
LQGLCCLIYCIERSIARRDLVFITVDKAEVNFGCGS